jgi:hypothetical protein
MNFYEKKIDKKKLVTSLFSLYSTRFIRQISLGLLVIPSQNRNCHGQHGHGVVFFTKLKKEATRKQSTKKKLRRLLAIILILRLVPRYCWLVVVLGQNERCHGPSSLMPDAQDRKHFLIDLCAFLAKGAPTVNLEKNRVVTFLHDYIELEGRTWPNALLSISSVHCAS